MKRYDKYKESGISWIGELPEHWEVKRLKSRLSIVKDRGTNSIKVGLENIESFTGKFFPSESLFDGEGIQVHIGDIVYGKLRPYLCKVWLASFECSAIGDFYVFRCGSDCDKRFMSYLFLSAPFTGVCNASTYGAKMPRVSSNFILSLPIPLPPLSEQKMIVSYLEAKVGQMDNLVAKREAQIAYLRELKQAVIAKAVTQGIDPQAPLRPSGIPWIGNVPEHWERQRCKDILTESKEQVGDKCDSYTLLSLTINGVVIRDVSEGKGKYPKDFETYKVVNPGNLIFCLFDVDETPRTVGYAHLQGMITGAYNIFSVESVSVDYLCYYFISLDDRKALKPLYKGLRKVVPLPTFMSMPIYLPPPSEQEAIVAYINRKTEEIDSLIAMTEQEIARVCELKQTVIADVVTGRINVQPS